MRFLTKVVLGGAVVAMLAMTASCSLSTHAAYNRDFPDPDVLRVGSTYYAFATQRLGGRPAIQRLVSPDHVHWAPTAQPDALKAVPRWAVYGATWAPAVQYVGGRYVMYYVLPDVVLRHQCLSTATAASPADQFVDVSTRPLICVPQGESIDPEPLLVANGRRVLVWRGPGYLGLGTIYSQGLTPDGLHLIGARSSLLNVVSGKWLNFSIEHPKMIPWDGSYLLFYSGNNYWTANYGEGYAVCRTPDGPCTNRTVNRPWLGSRPGAQGPGGASIFSDDRGHLFMAYHAWGSKVGYANGGIRAMWIDRLLDVNGIPVLGS